MMAKETRLQVLQYCAERLNMDVNTDVGTIASEVISLPAKGGLSVKVLNFHVFDRKFNHRAIIRASHIRKFLESKKTEQQPSNSIV
ncbi:MAG: hypothetical protein LAT67_04980 [Balneolales bacterium]|nr:hypothetical protein [Balneolales bacterium]